MKKTLIIVISLFAICASAFGSAQTPEERLVELGIELKTPNESVANYANAVKLGNLIFLSGKGPELPEGGVMTGKVGQGLTTEQGKVAARLTAITLLGVLKHELGELVRIEKIIKLNGMVNSTSDFTRHPEVVNGASDLLVEVFGDQIGKHARVAVGVNSLPFGIPVEIDMIVKVRE